LGSIPAAPEFRHHPWPLHVNTDMSLKDGDAIEDIAWISVLKAFNAPTT
jgi:hypothetical protein